MEQIELSNGRTVQFGPVNGDAMLRVRDDVLSDAIGRAPNAVKEYITERGNIPDVLSMSQPGKETRLYIPFQAAVDIIGCSNVRIIKTTARPQCVLPNVQPKAPTKVRNALRKIQESAAADERPDLVFDYTTRRIEQDFVVTPALAAAWLKYHCFRQRRVNRRNIEKIKRALHTNRFNKDTCDCFGFDPTGNLLNGQNRCTAVVETGIQMVVPIRFGVTPNTFRTEGIGKPRSKGDLAEIGLGVKNGRRFVAVADVMYALDTGALIERTYEESEPYYIEHQDSVSWAMGVLWNLESPELARMCADAREYAKAEAARLIAWKATGVNAREVQGWN